MTKHSKAYMEGVNAYIQFLSLRPPVSSFTNPYPEGKHERDSTDNQEHYDWERGWDDAWEDFNND